MTTPLSRAEQAVEDAREAAFREHCLPNLDLLIRAVEARYDARLREAANFPDVDDRASQAGHFFADVVAGWPTGSRIRFGPTEGLEAGEPAADTPCIPEGECPPGGWSTGCEVHNAGGYQLAALKAARAADLCQFHGPTGSPCDCGHGPTADCHPKERR